MAGKSILIIGAGIAGLSTGVYAQMNGYQSKILEMHTQAGGLVTAWKRRGYTIDGCIHWLVGSSSGSGLYRFWKEIGLIEGRQIIDHDIYQVYEGADGRVFNQYTNVDRLEKHMLELSPQDAEVIQDFTNGVRFWSKTSPPMGENAGLAGMLQTAGFMLKILPRMGDFRKWSKTTMNAYAARFKDPLLRSAMAEMGEFSVMTMMMMFAWQNQRVAGYPIGGSLPMIHNVEKRYRDLGGEIQYGARVEKILVDANGHAAGVRLANGCELRADIVVSAADGHATIFEMLEGRYVDDTIRGYYGLPTKTPGKFMTLKPFSPIMLVGVGVNRDFKDEPCSVAGINFELREPVVIADRPHKRLTAHLYQFDPSMAPAGKTVLTMIIETDYDYWKKLQGSREVYDAKKSEISETIVDCLEQRWPGIGAQIEMIDVSTPLTFERYTGNWRASFEGWQVTAETGLMQIKKTLPGLEDFYMAGQWVMPGGGLPGGVMTGRQVVGMICKKDHKKFETSIV